MLGKLYNNRKNYYLASIIFIVLGLICFAACLQRPYIGFEFKEVNGQWIVTICDPHGEGYKSGIEAGDRILKLNEQDPGKFSSVQKWNLPEGASTIEFCKPGQLISQKITIQKRPNFFRIFSEVPRVILGYIFWLLGFMTWFKRPFLQQARTLFWMNWLFALAIAFSHASGRGLPLARELEYITFSLAPVFLIAFFSLFPVHNINRINACSQKIVSALFIIISIITGLNSLGFVHLASLLRKLALLNMLIGIFISVWNLSLAIKLPKDRPEKNEAGIILLGLVIGFSPSILFMAIPTFFDSQHLFYSQIVYTFVAAVPISLYFVVVKKYLPDSRRLFEMIITYSLAGIMVSFVSLYILHFLNIVKTINPEACLTVFFLTLLFIACFHLIRSLISLLWKKSGLFSMQPQGLKQRIAELNSSLSSLFAEDSILEETVQQLGIDGALIIIENAQTGCLKKAVGRFRDNEKEQEQLIDYFHKNQLIDLEAGILSEDFPAEIYVPFISCDSHCGVFFGHRYSRIKFGQAEMHYVTLLAGQLAYQVLTRKIMEDLSKEIDFLTRNSWSWQNTNRRLQKITGAMFQKLEQERKRLASEIADGPWQVSLDLNRRLKYWEKEGLSGGNALQAFVQMRELTEDLKYDLRMIIQDLSPPILDDLGLIPAVELLCKELMFKEHTLISLEKKGVSRDRRFSEEVELTAYRFIQKGILNSIRYSGSRKQKVQIELSGNRLELTVSDLGRGFDAKEPENCLITGNHFGLSILKERLERSGGELQITSGIRQGTILKAALPVD